MSPPHADDNCYQNGPVNLIQGFGGLFGTADGRPPVQGIRNGATLLISGPPGSGKTTFALAMARALMAEIGSMSPPNKKVILYYISSEVHEKDLQATYDSFGWFAQSLASDSKVFLFRSDDPIPDKTNFYGITPMPEVDRPVPSPEELINGIFNRIAHTLSPSEAPAEQARIFVIVDSISALLKGCGSLGEERRQTHEIMHRLRDRFDRVGQKNLALTILLAEHDNRNQDVGMGPFELVPTLASVEDYLADIVFRLSVRPLPLGRRSRVLEVVKSQGVNMILGEHTWQIVTEENFKHILRHEGMQMVMKKACLEAIVPAEARRNLNAEAQSEGNTTSVSKKWGGIIIFPRPQLQRNLGTRRGGAELDPGIHGLQLEIQPGSTTLIAGPVGSGKSTLCKQFLKAEPVKENSGKPVLVSFDVFPAGLPESDIEVLDFTQIQFDLNVLVAHIRWVLDGENRRPDQVPTRLAFDGLSEWITLFDKPEAARMLEALMITVRQSSQIPTVFMTYELGLDDDPLGPHALGMTADNIVVVRQIAINDRLRKILYVLKSQTKRTALDVPRELIEAKDYKSDGKATKRVFEVASETLDSYTGLLDREGGPRAANVLLLLFEENKREEVLNRQLYQAIARQHLGRLNIKHAQFSRSEIGSTLDSVTLDRSPGDSVSLKVQSVDEWWLGTKETGSFLANLQTIWNGMETVSWHDYWSFEVEKATSLVPGQSGAIHAVPSSMDFGMLCINYSLWLKSNGQSRGSGSDPNLKTTKARKHWVRILAEVPRFWANRSEESESWFEINMRGGRPQSLLEYAILLTKQQGRPLLQRDPVFSFDMATRETSVCAFLEFAWAFGARENLLGLAQCEEVECALEKSKVVEALTFLQFMVLEGLMPERGTIKGPQVCPTELFTRHFYSTLPKFQEGECFMALPFMPTGLTDNDTGIDSALADIRTRLKFWIERVRTSNLTEDDVGILKRITDWQQSAPETGLLHDRLNPAVKCYGECRALLLRLAERDGCPMRIGGDTAQLPERKADRSTADLDDLIELTVWAGFRLQLLGGGGVQHFPETFKEPKNHLNNLRRAINSMRGLHQHLPDLRTLRPGVSVQPVFTGYGCTGSWMYGVSSRSRAPALQSQVLREMTSLEWAEKRANSGGGMPARKDFFHLHGGDAVPGMEYLNWREFLRYNGSRARRRDRVLKNKDGTHTIYTLIHRELLSCLRIAALHKQDYAAAIKHSASKEAQIIHAMRQRATSASEAIFQHAYAAVDSELEQDYQ